MKWVLSVLAVVVSVVIVAVDYQDDPDPLFGFLVSYEHPPDLRADWLVASAAREGLDPFSDVRDLAGSYGVEYDREGRVPRTPGALLLFQPVALVPADLLWLAGPLIVVGLLTLAAYRFDPLSVMWLPLFFVSVVGWDIGRHGHVSMAFLGLAAVMLVGAPHRPSTGVAVGMAATLKLYPAFWSLALWLAGHRRAAVVSGGTFLALNAGGMLLPGVTLAGLSESVAATETLLERTRNGSLLRYGAPLWVLVAIGLLFLVWWRRDTLVRASLPASLLVAPVAWVFYLVTVLAAFPGRVAAWFVGGWVLYRVAWSVWLFDAAAVAPFSALAALVVLWRMSGARSTPVEFPPKYGSGRHQAVGGPPRSSLCAYL